MSERNDKAIKMAADFMNFCNGASREQIETFANEVTTDHRTIQQTAFATMMKAVELWSNQFDDHCHDARNYMTVKACSEIVKALDMDKNPDAPLFCDKKLLGLPYI